MRHVMAGVQSVPRVMRGAPVVDPRRVDVPLSERALAGLESQGLARTLGSLAGSTLGDDIEMPEECVRRGGCGPDQRKPVDPYATPPAKDTVKGMSTTTIALAAVGAVGLIYYLSKRP